VDHALPPGRPLCDERAVEERLYSRLEGDFVIKRQVRGRLFGFPVRIDAVLTPRDPWNWKTGDDTALGIEVKDISMLAHDFRNIASWAAQCIDYSYSEWDDYGRIPIFTYPAISDYLQTEFHPLPHILGQFNVGEIRDTKNYGMALVMHQMHRIWSEANGVERGRHWRMRPRRGNPGARRQANDSAVPGFEF
jgi:hypothetical protein